MDDKNKNENAEVDLRDYLKLIFSKKRLVLGIFLVAIIMAVIYNYSTPKIYEISAWLEIGKIKENAPLESLAQIAKKIKNDIYGVYSYPINVVSPDLTDLVQISFESTEPEKAKDDLGKLSALILTEHEGKIKTKREAIQNEIQRIQENEIPRIQENEIPRIQEKIVLLKQEKKILEAKIEIPISQFDLFFLKDSLLRKNFDIEDLYSKIEDLYSKIEGLYSEIDSLKDSFGNIQSTKIVKDPAISDTPIRPKFSVNIIIGGLLGLFLGISITLWGKWWKESRI